MPLPLWGLFVGGAAIVTAIAALSDDDDSSSSSSSSSNSRDNSAELKAQKKRLHEKQAQNHAESLLSSLLARHNIKASSNISMANLKAFVDAPEITASSLEHLIKESDIKQLPPVKPLQNKIDQIKNDIDFIESFLQH